MSIKRLQNPGPNFAPAYQTSGTPFVTSSNGANINATAVKVEFPYVTRFFEVTNISDQVMRIGFSALGVQDPADSSAAQPYGPYSSNRNYLILSGTQRTGRLEIRCKELYIRADVNANKVGFSLIAGLTGIKEFPLLTGSISSTGSFQGIG